MNVRITHFQCGGIGLIVYFGGCTSVHLSTGMDGFEGFNEFNDSFEEPVYEHSVEPARTVKEANPNIIRTVAMDSVTIKGFVENNPNSFVIVSTKSKGLLRLDPKRKTKYQVMLIPSLRDSLEHKNKNLV